MKIAFSKMSGCGNDFILIDNRQSIIDIPSGDLALKICNRHYGVGADGLIIIEKSDAVDFRMKFYNSDGGEAEMCGNGARCVSLFAYIKNIAKNTMVFETVAGNIEGQVFEDGNIQINIGEVNFKLSEGIIDPLKLGLENKINGSLYYLNVGVPHTICFTDNLDSMDVETIGREIRYNKKFAPEGTNVNFVSILNSDSLAIRTYERGVEAETMACGTGSSAAAIVAYSLGFLKLPIHVYTKNNCLLVVNFKQEKDLFESLLLRGEARIICEGNFWIEE